MRVIAGKYKGRRIDCPKGNAVRPTLDMVRGAVFNVLNNYLHWEDVIAMDAFCGTGALGLEALSRGAKFASFVDNADESISYAKKNLEKAESGSYEILRLNAEKIPCLRKDYNLVFLDPPYHTNLAQDCLELIIKNEMLAQTAFVVLEVGKEQQILPPQGMENIFERTYGAAKILILSK